MTRITVPRAAVRARPLQHLEVPAKRRVGAKVFFFQATFPLQVLQRA
eukprot:CAMPEP_0119224198 /NCGR_PEP_ID=MMETSP1327-20130426/33547_1 /TAXON_ID=38833 /ORGANISM="Micromonas pusilla, Strain RCC2306" /LENGTH=46 /DNA_ID= /DNA_START= /DNA_END= /DNA_ORIENTATION=